jgi:hypothetical protein
VSAFSQDITVFVSDLGPAATQSLVQAAQDTKSSVEADQQARRGIKPLTNIAVDGQAATDFSAVKPQSVVFEYWDYRAEIIAACFEELRARAPVVSGEYRDSFYASLDGSDLKFLEVPPPERLTGVSQIIITNPVPYARRLEVGTTEKGAAFVKQVEPHIVESAMTAVRREFTSVAKFSFTYVDRAEGYVKRTNFGVRRPSESKTRGAGTQIRYPAIVIDQA